MKRTFVFPALVVTGAAWVSAAAVACGGSNGASLFAPLDDASTGGTSSGASGTSGATSGGTSGTTSGGTSGTTSGGTSGTTSGGVRDAGPGRDAGPTIGDGGPLSGDAAAAADGQVACGTLTCSVSSQTCCVQPDAGASCIANGNNCQGAVAVLRCEKAADCNSGSVCCFEAKDGTITATC